MLTPAHRLVPAVGLAAHISHGVQRIATDAAIGRMRSLPRRIGDLDAAYLSRLTGRTIESVSVVGGDAGTSSRARLALSGGPDIPESVFVKMPAETAATRMMGELGGWDTPRCGSTNSWPTACPGFRAPTAQRSIHSPGGMCWYWKT